MLPPRLNPERLVSHLSQLPPEACAFLLREIELHRHLGQDDPSYEHVLGAVRQLARIEKSSVERLATPLRLFCQPFEDLLIDERFGARAPARVSRTSIAPVWNWLTGPHGPEALRDHIVELSAAAHGAGRGGNADRQRRMIATLASAIEAELELADASRRRHAQLESLLGGPDLVRDLATMAAAFRAFAAVSKLRTVIPARIVELTPGIDAEVSAALNSYHHAVPGSAELGFATVLARMVAPTEALRIAVRALSANDAARLQESIFAPLAELLLSDLEIAARKVDRLVRQCAEPAEILEALDRFHHYARGIDTELDLSARDAWGMSLAASRRIASEALEADLRRLPNQISSLFKPYINDRSAKTLPAPDSHDVEAASRALMLCRDSRQFLDQLSLNEALMRCDEAIPARLTVITDALVNDLRTTAGDRQAMVGEWFEAAVVLTGIAIGSTDAGLVARSGQVASESARKAGVAVAGK